MTGKIKKKKMFTDIDSLFYEIKTDDVYEDLLKDKKKKKKKKIDNSY